MPSTTTVLKAIGSIHPVTWSTFIHQMPDRPHAYAERSEWREVLQSVGALEDMDLILVVRNKSSNQIESLALTALGDERLRESLAHDQVVPQRRQIRVPRPYAR